MPAVLMTPDNIEALKSVLRRELSQIKSSHITEALAFALGYRTHAALLAALKPASLTKPVCGTFDTGRLAKRLSDFGAAVDGDKCLTGTLHSCELPDRIWVSYRNGDRFAHEAWFYECRRRGIPFVFIETRRTYVRLNWDCITIDPSEESHVRGKVGNELGRTMFQTFQAMARGAPGKPMFEASSFVGHVDRLLPELAYRMADTFFSMLYEPTRVQARAA